MIAEDGERREPPWSRTELCLAFRASPDSLQENRRPFFWFVVQDRTLFVSMWDWYHRLRDFLALALESLFVCFFVSFGANLI